MMQDTMEMYSKRRNDALVKQRAALIQRAIEALPGGPFKQVKEASRTARVPFSRYHWVDVESEVGLLGGFASMAIWGCLFCPWKATGYKVNVNLYAYEDEFLVSLVYDDEAGMWDKYDESEEE